MRIFDFSTLSGTLTALLGLALFALMTVGIRLLVMLTIQARRERMNRQINERLKILIAAYKTLGGSFTGELDVDPTHMREIRRQQIAAERAADTLASAPSIRDDSAQSDSSSQSAGMQSDRNRRIRDAVEAALSDVILLGTEDQVRLAVQAANDLAAGRRVSTGALVVSLRDFIRKALDLEPIPDGVSIPRQGPTRPSASSGRGRGNDGRAGGGRLGGGQGGGSSGVGAAGVGRMTGEGQDAP